jgi:hypothetical protein
MVGPALRRFFVDRGGLIALAALVTYIWIAPVHIVDGDNAEMATLGVAGGVAHPTGYPAYLLWLRATTWLPGSSPAHTAAIATAILAAVQLLVLHAACRAWGARPIAATLAVAVYAASPVAMRYSSEAEVFALNQLVVATVLYLAARQGPLRGSWRVAALGLAAGIGIADHVTCVLAAPVGLLGAVRGVREARRSLVAVVAGIVGLAAGMTPYLYLLATSENSISWASLDGAHDVLDHILRTAYGGPGTFSARHRSLHPGLNLVAFGATLGRAWWWLGALVGLAMLGYRSVRRRDGEPRIAWQMLALAFLVCGPVLAMRFDIIPEGLSLYVARRFHLMATLIIAVPVAAALDLVIARYQAWLRAEVTTAIAVLAFATAALLTVPDVMRVRTPAAEHAMRGMLRGLPPNAVVFVTGDITFYGAGYLQVACGERPDVIVALWNFVGSKFYRDRLARKGIVIDTTETEKPSLRVADQILSSGRPLLADMSLGNVLMQFPNYPYGTLFRILPRGSERPTVDKLAEINRDWFAALDLDYPRPSVDDEYPAEIHLGYAQTWRIIADAFLAAGKHGDADNAGELMRQFAPTP